MPGATFLRGDRLTLDAVAPEDYAFLAALHNEPQSRRQAGISLPWSAADVADLVEEREDAVVFLACREGEPVGSVLLGEIDTQARTAEIGYLVAPGERGNGYATEAAGLCLRHAFDDRDLQRVWATVNEENDASVRVLEKLGFTREGTLRAHEYADGERVDVRLYGILAAEWSGLPSSEG